MTDRTHPDSGRTTGGIVKMLQDRVAELEAHLEAIGAGGVSGPLMGRASLSANAGGEPVAWRYRSGSNGNWEDCTKEVQDMVLRAPQRWAGYEVQPLYARPSPPEGMVMVPKVPTNAMTSAGANAVEDPENERSSWDLAENMWRAMIAAAPPLPASEAGEAT